MKCHTKSDFHLALFSDTPAGAEATAIVYTLMETAKANNLRLEDYIEHLLAVLPERFADDLEADIDDLLPTGKMPYKEEVRYVRNRDLKSAYQNLDYPPGNLRFLQFIID